MSESSPGKVWLVGAGPGDPGLLTLRGRALLERADVVVYDQLANPKLLDYCPPGCQQIYVGKRAAAHSMSQEQINELIVEQARSGKRVVRLKGGDPFVFGRGGEEALELARADVPFEIVPGITAGIAGPAYAGIPVTHRDFTSSFTVITGHEKEDEAVGTSDLDWSAIARLQSIAFYMGVKSLPRICQKLIDHGAPRETPAATIQHATTPRQRTVVATIEDLPQRVADAGIGAPAITIVGKVVELRETINWFESRPLFGKTIAVTRTRQQASELSRHLEELGANVIEAPTIMLEPPKSWDDMDAALGARYFPPLPLGEGWGEGLTDAGYASNPQQPLTLTLSQRERGSDWDWIIFTSVNGVRFTRERLRATRRDARAFGNAKIAAIGEPTANAARDLLFLNVDLCPREFVAEALADELAARSEIAGKRFLLLRANIARPLLRERLIAAHAAEVRDVAIYQTKIASSLPPELLQAVNDKRLDWVTFTSSSTARNFTELLGRDYPARLADVKLASIGPITTLSLRELGLEPSVQAEKFDVDGLVASIVRASSQG